MRKPGKGARLQKRAFRFLLVIAYFPVSLSCIGLLAYHMRCPSPVVGRYPFADVFFFYAHPLNLKYIDIHSITLWFGFLFLVLLASSAETSKKLVTITQLRVMMVTLVILVTLLVEIFLNTLIGLTPMTGDARRDVLIPLFLYVDVHLILLFLYTYLPPFRGTAQARTVSSRYALPFNLR